MNEQTTNRLDDDTAGADTAQGPLDPAQRSLADALHVSFWVLKLVMLLLVVLYLFSGVFNVSEHEKAVRLRFGRIVGGTGRQVLDPGGPYFSLPFPFEQIVTVPTAPRQIELDRVFWYETNADGGLASSSDGGKAGPLDPRKDGSLLTGDTEIIHARWSVTYVVDDPISYLARVKSTAVAERMVRTATQQGVVYAVAGLTADQLLRSQDVSAARRRAQEVLDSLESGIKVISLSVRHPTFPLSVQPAVQAVLNAESVRAKLIEEAQEQWGRMLIGAAGEGADPLLGLIEEYETASLSNDAQRLDELEHRFDTAFLGLEIESGGRVIGIGGEVARMMHEAMTYRTEVVAAVRNEADYFNSLLPQYRENPHIVRSRLWQDARQRILSGDVETMYLPRGQAYLDINRDPKVRQNREKKRLIREDEARQANP